MNNEGIVRIGGICGLLCVLATIPAYVVGYPDAPGSSAEAESYFPNGGSGFVLANGLLPLFHVFLFMIFLAVLYSLLRNAEGGGIGLSPAVLVGGVVFASLTSIGYAVESVYPATLVRFGEIQPDVPFVLISLALAAWIYHFCQVGTAVMVMSASLVGAATGTFPGWLALAGLLVALIALMHFIIPLTAALTGLLWITVVSVLMITGAIRLPRSAPR